jgi:hypothetical protein
MLHSRERIIWRDRLTERDRLNLEVFYYADVVGDLEREYSSVFRLLQIFARDVFAHNNLSVAFGHLDRPDRAADEASETARLQPSPYYFGAAIKASALHHLGQLVKQIVTIVRGYPVQIVRLRRAIPRRIIRIARSIQRVRSGLVQHTQQMRQ